MRPPAAINIGSVFRIFESDLPFAECFSASNTCPLVEACWLRNAIGDAVDAFYRSLDKVLLSDLVNGNDELAALLRFHAPIGCSRPGGHSAQPGKAAQCDTSKALDSAPVS